MDRAYGEEWRNIKETIRKKKKDMYRPLQSVCILEHKQEIDTRLLVVQRSCDFFCLPQHFREHLDKLFAKGIGLLGNALTEAFTILNEVGQAVASSVSFTITLNGYVQL